MSLTEERDYVIAGCAALARLGAQGALLATVYAREKQHGRLESGVALFGGDTQSSERQPIDVLRGVLRLDGVPAAFVTQANGTVATATRFGRPFPKFIDMDPVFATELGTIVPIALVVEHSLFLLETDLDDDDPAFAEIVAAGVDDVVHLPAVVGWPRG
ncbi:hypothetical protein LBMAG42_55890 [Deltaproteobacteria bacterium]|nr:hypothetical protein LBMAG42_55890 [Deltaproteobacteria bacterium]